MLRCAPGGRRLALVPAIVCEQRVFYEVVLGYAAEEGHFDEYVARAVHGEGFACGGVFGERVVDVIFHAKYERQGDVFIVDAALEFGGQDADVLN